MAQRGTVVVVGGGIIGTVAARRLAADGWAVTVLEPGPLEAACSFGNGGAVGPDSCVPFSLPGMMRQVPRWLMDATGPVSVAPAYALRAAPWLWRWIRAGNLDRARAVATAMRALHGDSLTGYRELLGPAAYGALFRETGSLYLYESDEPGRAEATGRALQRNLGVTPQSLSAADIHDLEPDLAPVYKRGVLLPGNAFTISPARLVAAVRDGLVAAGGTVRPARARRLSADGDGPVVTLDDGQVLRPDRLVVAAGARSARLVRALAPGLPLEAERGYHVLCPTPGVRLNHKIMNGSRGFGMTPMAEGLQITGTVEIAGLDAPPDRRRTDALLAQGRRLFPGLGTAGMTTWLGLRPSFPDSLPVIDLAPGRRDVVLAFGHSHWGLSGAPVTGQLVADLLAGRPPAIDPAPYRAGRFG